MCDYCQPFESRVVITETSQLKLLHDHLFFDGIKPGIIEVLSGSLQWNDSIQCNLRCAHCKQRFEFACQKFCSGEYGPTS